MAAYDVTTCQIGRAEVTYKGAVLGYMESVAVTRKDKFEDIKCSQTLDIVLDKRFRGCEGAVEAICSESQIATIKQNFPWYSGSGQIPFVPPAIGQSMYALAGALLVHPLENASGTAEDWNFTKAVPAGDVEVKYDGKPKMRKVTFVIFPDQAQLPGTLSMGTLG